MDPPLGTDALPKEPTHKGDIDCIFLVCELFSFPHNIYVAGNFRFKRFFAEPNWIVALC